MLRAFSIATFLVLCVLSTTAQLVISGTIRDTKSGEAIPFVDVVIQANHRGTTTNVDGHFTLFSVPSDTSTILVSHLGYGLTRYQLTPENVNKPLSIEIAPATINLRTFEITEAKDQTIEVNEEVSKMTINPALVINLPNMGEVDILRSIQLLPGVSGSTETSGLYIRGGTPDQNLVLFDGITIYHVDHFFGIFSAFNANAVKDVQVYKGGFEARYGGRVSSVVDITGKSGNSKEFTVTGGVNMLSTNLVLEGPVFSDKFTFLVAGRRSYTDIITSPTYQKIFDNIEEEETADLGFGIASVQQIDPKFYFFDLNSKLTFRPTDKDNISISGYGGQDDLDNSSTESFGLGGNSAEISTTDVTNWGNRGTSLRWSRQWNKKYYSVLSGAYSNYFSDYLLVNSFKFDTLEFSASSVQDNDVEDLSFRFDNQLRMNGRHTFEFGAWSTYNEVHYVNIVDDTITLQDTTQYGNLFSFYFQDTYQPFNRIKVKPGIRASYYDVTDKYYFEPRLSAYYNLNDNFRLKGAWGIYYQFINRIVLENIFGGSRDFWLLSDDDVIPVVKAIHYVAGAAYENKSLLVDVELWQKDMTGLLEYTLRYGTLAEAAGDPDNLFYTGTGVAKGLDLLIQRKFGKFTGWISYTLSQVEYTFSQFDKGDPFPALHDQTHEGKAVAQLKLGHFNLAATYVYATGRPYTAPIGIYELTLIDGVVRPFIHVGDKNSQRLPDYHRMDFAVNYEVLIKQTVEFKAGVSLFNVYNRKNTKYKRYQLLEYDPETFMPIDPQLVVTDINMLGFIPNFFIHFKF